MAELEPQASGAAALQWELDQQREQVTTLQQEMQALHSQCQVAQQEAEGHMNALAAKAEGEVPHNPYSTLPMAAKRWPAAPSPPLLETPPRSLPPLRFWSPGWVHVSVTYSYRPYRLCSASPDWPGMPQWERSGIKAGQGGGSPCGWCALPLIQERPPHEQWPAP